MTKLTRLAFSIGLLAAACLPRAASAQSLAPPAARPLPSCASLATDPSFGLAGAAGVGKLSAVVVRGQNPSTAYCQVELTYNSGKSGPKDGYPPGQSQAIGIRVGLPLRADDGGAGAWNGRIHNLGSGGCMGNLPGVTPATNFGYVGSSSDGGHVAPYVGFNCDFGVVQEEHRLNAGLIRDFSKDHVIWQTRWAKRLTETYYGAEPEFTYWSGCSQGGRQGDIAFQEIPGEYDGILSGGAALYWMRFQMAQAWSGLVIKDVLGPLGKTLTTAQIAATVKAEVAGCDTLDGVLDGEIRDPRVCHWSAKNAICGARAAAAQNCLDADQARAFDTVRRGPVNSRGEQIWFPWEPGTTFSNNTNYLLSDGVMRWAVADTKFSSKAHLYLDKKALQAAHDPVGITYEDLATLAARRGSDLADTDAMPPASVKDGRLKVIAWTGTADRNIQSRNSIKYYRDVAAHMGTKASDSRFQAWYRLFLYPGVDHCIGGDGHQPGDINTGPLFEALVAWVEQGQAPERILATHYEKPMSRDPRNPDSAAPPAGALISARPICAYPKAATYKGSGPITDTNSFTCAGNMETGRTVEQLKLARHNLENGTGNVGPPYGP
jgi:feruloyl esterase